MKKCNCANCVCLVEGNNGEWICDEANKPIEEVENCPEGMEETKMTNERIKELYDNMLNHISELVSGVDLVDTLHAIGFTDEEIVYEGLAVINKEAKNSNTGTINRSKWHTVCI